MNPGVHLVTIVKVRKNSGWRRLRPLHVINDNSYCRVLWRMPAFSLRTHARAFDNRGRELTKRIFSFHNDLEGFNSFNLWAETLKTENKKTAVLIGCEPTGHYWFAFAKYVNDHQKRLVMVNPFSVKKIKELDDNSPKKTDSKDPKTIAKLVVDGRYSIPYMPEGIYAEIRDLVYSREPIWII